MDRLAWLHGWTRSEDGTSVWCDGRTCCVGCGRWDGGLGSFVVDPDYIPPPEPDWPFPETDCPVCTLRPYYLDAGDEVEVRAITRALAGPGGVAQLRDLRRRARAWVAAHPASGTTG